MLGRELVDERNAVFERLYEDECAIGFEDAFNKRAARKFWQLALNFLLHGGDQLGGSRHEPDALVS